MSIVINISGATWYNIETSIPNPTNIRVYKFGFNSNTICNVVGDGIISPELAYQYAQNGLAEVYVSHDTPTRNNIYVPDDTPFHTALTLIVLLGIVAMMSGRS